MLPFKLGVINDDMKLQRPQISNQVLRQLQIVMLNTFP